MTNKGDENRKPYEKPLANEVVRIYNEGNQQVIECEKEGFVGFMYTTMSNG